MVSASSQEPVAITVTLLIMLAWSHIFDLEADLPQSALLRCLGALSNRGRPHTY